VPSSSRHEKAGYKPRTPKCQHHSNLHQICTLNRQIAIANCFLQCLRLKGDCALTFQHLHLLFCLKIHLRISTLKHHNAASFFPSYTTASRKAYLLTSMILTTYSTSLNLLPLTSSRATALVNYNTQMSLTIAVYLNSLPTQTHSLLQPTLIRLYLMRRVTHGIT
jgi:hypothetical protein